LHLKCEIEGTSCPARSGYIPRSLERTLRRAAREFPVVVLTGPRQSGKTTLLKHAFGSRHTYQVFLLRPYHANVGKRLEKTPKVYMADVGLLCIVDWKVP